MDGPSLTHGAGTGAGLLTNGALSLGVDIGTGSTKVVVCDRDGTVLETRVRHHRVDLPARGHVEQDAEAVWWEELTEAIRSVDADLRRRVGALAVSGLGPCVLLTDDQCRPLRPAILYGVDTRAVAEIAEIEAELGPAEIERCCGSKLSTQAAGPKLRWLARHEPDVVARAEFVHSAPSFVVHRLTGRYVMDHHTASQYDPLYDLDGHRWIGPWWDSIAGGIAKPELAWSGETAGVLTRAGAEATGLSEGIAVTTGCVDAWAEAYSVGVAEPGRLMVMYGTTMFFIAPTAARIDHPALWTTTGVHSHGYCLAGGMATSGALTTWFAGLANTPVAELFAAAAGSPAGARGLLVLPYFAGERTPIADPAASGLISGLTLRHDRGDVFRALLEATAMGVRHNVSVLAAAGAPVDQLVAVGGGTRGDLWAQIVSDVTGTPQVVPAVTIGAAFGDARLAGEALGWDTSEWVTVDHVVEPSANRSRYDDLWPLYLDAYRNNADLMHRLHDLSADQDTQP